MGRNNVRHVDFCFLISIGKHLIWISAEVRSYIHMRTFFQQNPPLTFGRAMLLKSEFDILYFPYSVIKIDMISHLRSSCFDDYISILLNKMSLLLLLITETSQYNSYTRYALSI